MERDPGDGKITFLEVDIENFKIESLGDVAMFFDGLHQVAQQVLESEGFVVYPIVKIESLGNGAV